MKKENRLWLLIAKKIAAEISEKELRELKKLSQMNPDADYFLEILSGLWHSPEAVNIGELENTFNVHLQRMKKQSVKFV